MSENDEVKPFHAKDVASGQEAADAVAAVLKHAHEREEAAKQKSVPKGQPKWMLPLGLNLGVFAAYLLIWSPDWVIINRIQPPPAEAQVQNTRLGVYTIANRIEAYMAQNGRLPSSLLEALGRETPGVEYTVQGSNYVLYTEVGDQPISFNSAVQSLEDWGEANAAEFSTRIGG